MKMRAHVSIALVILAMCSVITTIASDVAASPSGPQHIVFTESNPDTSLVKRFVFTFRQPMSWDAVWVKKSNGQEEGRRDVTIRQVLLPAHMVAGQKLETSVALPESIEVSQILPIQDLVAYVDMQSIHVFYRDMWEFVIPALAHDETITGFRFIVAPDTEYAAISVMGNQGESATYSIRTRDETVKKVSDTYMLANDIGVVAAKDAFDTGLLQGPRATDDASVSAESHQASKPPSSQDVAQAALSYASRRVQQSTIVVKNSDGVDVSAWHIVKDFAINLNDSAPRFERYSSDETSRLKNRSIFRNLVKKEIGNVKILGPAGTGKTTLIKQMMAELIQGAGPQELHDTLYLQIDASALMSGTAYVGSVDTKVNAMLALSRQFKIVWVIDEAHVLKGMGASEGDSNDIVQKFKQALTEGYFRMIAMSTDHEWDRAFQQDPALNQRFSKIAIEEPRDETLLTRLNSFVKRHDFPEIPSAEMDLIVRLSSEFNAEGAQPRKSTLLIEEIFAEQKLDGELHVPSEQEIKLAAASLYNLNQRHFDPQARKAQLKELPKILDDNVIGQAQAKSVIERSARYAAADLEDKSKPKGRILLAGPKGQGKTEMVKAYGRATDRPVERIMMTAYASSYQLQNLKRRIAHAVQANALTILFFDEIEKAPREIQQDLLDLMDSGEFAVPASDEPGAPTIHVNIRNAEVIFAANAGTSYINSLKDSSEYQKRKMIEAMKADGLNEYLLDRIEAIAPFFYLTRDEYRQVVMSKVRAVIQEARGRHPNTKFRIENIRGLVDQVVYDTYQAHMGNREALVAVSEELRDKLSIGILEAEGVHVNIKLEGRRRRDLPARNEELDEPERVIGFARPPAAGRCEQVASGQAGK